MRIRMPLLPPNRVRETADRSEAEIPGEGAMGQLATSSRNWASALVTRAPQPSGRPTHQDPWLVNDRTYSFTKRLQACRAA